MTVPSHLSSWTQRSLVEDFARDVHTSGESSRGSRQARHHGQNKDTNPKSTRRGPSAGDDSLRDGGWVAHPLCPQGRPVTKRARHARTRDTDTRRGRDGERDGL